QSKPAFQALQTCAERAHHFQTLLDVSYALFDAGMGHPAFVISALNGLGRYQDAIDTAVKIAKADPKKWNHDPLLEALAGFSAIGKEDYKTALAMAELTYATASKTKDTAVRNELTAKAAVIGFKAFYFMGRFDEASHAVDKWAAVMPNLPDIATAR